MHGRFAAGRGHNASWGIVTFVPAGKGAPDGYRSDGYGGVVMWVVGDAQKRECSGGPIRGTADVVSLNGSLRCLLSDASDDIFACASNVQS
jgi:hypothetical protein